MPVGIDTLTATPQTIELGGRQLRLSPLTLADMGVLQAWIHAQLPDPIALARRLAEGMPAEVQTELLRDAFKHAMAAKKSHMIGTDEADEFLASMQGVVQMLALMCRAHHPDVSADFLAPLVGGLDKDKINAIVMHAFGIAPRSSEVAGADATAGAGDPKAEGGPDAAGAPTTPGSSSTSPAATDGPPTSSAG